MDLIVPLSWVAVLILASSYWFQIWKIHNHKEVRDLSLTYHVLLAIGFGVLIFTALIEESQIFLAKQIATFVPVVIIIGQILIHRKDHWHDEKDELCKKCGSELEPDWKHCPYCGNIREITPKE
ncbi:MAG: zinc-ribbon domain-containing protein [bacterium]|nr:zinc-ribbon domain-containing protein [bacterium]